VILNSTPRLSQPKSNLFLNSTIFFFPNGLITANTVQGHSLEKQGDRQVAFWLAPVSPSLPFSFKRKPNSKAEMT